MIYTFINPQDHLLSRVVRLEDAIPYQTSRDTYAQSNTAQFSSVSTDVVQSGGMVDLAGSGISTLGSIPPTINNSGFAATATTTSITWYWDGTNSSSVIVIRRADGTRFTVPPNSLTITGLTANTWYGFLPFWAISSLCAIGWVAGDSGTPLIAFAGGTGASFAPTASVTAQADAAALQIFQGREQLSEGFMTFRTPAAGTSSGVATGGGTAGKCVMSGTHIETLGDLPYSTAVYSQSEWQRLVLKDGRSLNCTPNHALYHPEAGKVRADYFKPNDWLMSDKGESRIQEVSRFMRACTKHEIRMDEGHLYFANGFLSHNGKGSYI